MPDWDAARRAVDALEASGAAEAAETERRKEAERRALGGDLPKRFANLSRFLDQQQIRPLLRPEELKSLEAAIGDVERDLGACNVKKAFMDLVSCSTLGRSMVKLSNRSEDLHKAIEELDMALTDEVYERSKTCLCRVPPPRQRAAPKSKPSAELPGFVGEAGLV